MERQGWTAGALALALMAGATPAVAQSVGDLVRKVGQAAGNSPRSANERLRSPYLEPVGSYWDHDGETLAGAVHFRGGLAATGRQGVDVCDAELLAMAHSAYRLDARQRNYCLRQYHLVDRKVHGDNGIGNGDTEAIERRYGPAFDARLARFKATRRFATRPNFLAEGGVECDRAKGTLAVFVPVPWKAGVIGVTGPGFVPWTQRDSRVIWSPKNAGRYHLPLRMDPAECSELFKQGRDFRDDLVVYTVNRVWVEDTVPKMDVTVERVHVGFQNETIEVDTTTRTKGGGA